MIPRTLTPWQASAWQHELSQSIRSPSELLAILGLPLELLPPALRGAADFSLRVPRHYVARMEHGNPHDPLLLQVLPVADEHDIVPGFGVDAVGDLAAMVAPGVLHKYHGRALLVTTGACAIHCRYCFRRHFPYPDANPATDQWQEALAYFRRDPSLSEVILSGGDPLTLTDQRLADLSARLATIPHLRYLRIHTRLPVVLPSRVNDALLAWLTGTRLKSVMVIHANHAHEIDACVQAGLARLRDAGVLLLNQSVLLRGVNDSVAAQAALSYALFDAGVTPYYLHLLDRVHGTAHFDVSLAAARQLMRELNTRLPGYLVPRLVRETSGAPSKQTAFAHLQHSAAT